MNVWEQEAIPVNVWEQEAEPYTPTPYDDFWEAEEALPDLDTSTGVPGRVRAAVGAEERDPADRLATLQEFYPDAQPYQGDNFIYTNPETGKATLYNPPGPDWGDIPEEGRMITEMVGGGVGAVAGSVAGPVGAAMGAGVGGAGGAALYDYFQNLVSDERVDTRTLMDNVNDVSLDFILNAGGQFAGDKLSQGLRSFFRRGNAEDFKGSIQEQFDANLRQVKKKRDWLAPWKTVEVEEPLAAAALVASESPVLENAASVLKWLPTSSKTMIGATEELNTALQREFKDVASKFASGQPMDVDEMNDFLNLSAQRAAGQFKTTERELFNDLTMTVGENTPVVPNNIARLQSELAREYAQAPSSSGYMEPILKRIEGLVDDAYNNGGAIGFKKADDLLTDVGQSMKQPNTVSGYSGQQQGLLKRVYGELKQDVMDTARAAGAEDQMRDYDSFVRKWNESTEPVLSGFRRRQADQAYNYALSGSKQGAAKLRELRGEFTPEEWGQFGGTVIEQMGKARAGAQDATGEVFSPVTFMTRWSQMSNAAKRELFDDPNLRVQLDRLVNVTDRAKQMLSADNTSRTAVHDYYGALLAGQGYHAWYDPGTGLPAIAGPYITAKTLTSPRFVDWLAQLPEQTTATISGHMARLLAIGEKEPDLQEDIAEILNDYDGAD